MLAASAVITVLHGLYGENDEGKGTAWSLYGCVAICLLWMGLLMLLRDRRKKAFRIAAMVLLTGELSLQAFYNCTEQGLTASIYAEAFDRQTKEFISVMQMDVLYSEGLYRAHLANSPYVNQSAMYDYMGIGQFASSNYGSVQKLMSRLGDAVMTMRYTQTGATDATDMIFGIRYRGFLTYPDDTVREQGPGYEVYERALPLAFMASADLAKMEAFDGNPFENQNRLLSALCGENIRAYAEAERFGYDAEGAEFTATEKGFEIRSLSAESYGDVLFGIPEEGYEHAYMYIQLLPYEENAGERLLDKDMATDIAMYSSADRKGSGGRFNAVQENAVMEMTKDGNAFVLRIADFEGPEKTYRYTAQYFGYQDEAELDRAHEILKRNTFRAELVKDGYISGKVYAAEDQPLLFISIPYDAGWTYFVDGEESRPLTVVNDCFPALYLTPGEHRITLEYEAPGAIPGRILSLCGVISLLLMIVYEKRKKDKILHETKKNGHQ